MELKMVEKQVRILEIGIVDARDSAFYVSCLLRDDIESAFDNDPTVAVDLSDQGLRVTMPADFAYLLKAQEVVRTFQRGVLRNVRDAATYDELCGLLDEYGMEYSELPLSRVMDVEDDGVTAQFQGEVLFVSWDALESFAGPGWRL